MTQSLIFDPLVPWPALWGAVSFAALLLVVAVWRGLAGWPLRILAAVAVLGALANPSLQEEDRQAQSNIVIAVVDESSSQQLGDRAAQTAKAVADLQSRVAALGQTELRVVRFGDGEKDAGSLAMTAFAEAVAEEPRARLAGAVLITDGRVHDIELSPDFPAPVHVLLTGQPQDWDRRLIIKNAPAFAILGEEVTLTLRIEDDGAAPALVDGMVDLTIAVDSDAPTVFRVPVGQDLDLPVTLPHGGQNVLQFSVAEVAGELTNRNNAAVVQINGVRDRLRVLLVSGEPHAGERVWRNLLKSDASVDLVHFTILRPPEKQDGIPVSELSLIAFPTRELFVEKIDQFDLIVFDRYRMRGILPMSYLENIVSYVRNGGTVLVAAGPEYGAVDSIWRSPLSEILPASPTAQVVEKGFRPKLTDLGHRHPVTEGLESAAPEGGWGRWMRMVDVTPTAGQVVMEGADDRPLLILNRVDQGRVAILASDQAWLWGRGFEGGGPQLELLRRLAHWMLKEPELEEEALSAQVSEGPQGQVLSITRRSILPTPPGAVTVIAPDGAQSVLPMQETAPGQFTAQMMAPAMGLYRLQQGDLSRVIAVGPSAPREFVETIASAQSLQPLVDATLGGVIRLSDGFPNLREVREDRPAAGNGWIGFVPREAFVVQDIRISALLPAWLWLLLAAGLSLGAWLIEGRKGAKRA